MKTPILIPLGIDCSVAHFLRMHGIRNDAYPFDWNVTPMEAAFELVENGFEDFLKLENLDFLSPTNRQLFEESGRDIKISNEIITPVVCRRYGILFPHDFTGSGVDDYEKVTQKYTRRIERFREHTRDKAQFQFVYNYREINDWQAKQYEYAGAKFVSMTDRHILETVSKIEAEGYRITSLQNFKSSYFRTIRGNLSLVKRVLQKVLKS